MSNYRVMLTVFVDICLGRAPLRRQEWDVAGWDDEELECSWNSAMTTLFWSLACIGMILLSILCRAFFGDSENDK